MRIIEQQQTNRYEIAAIAVFEKRDRTWIDAQLFYPEQFLSGCI